MDQTEESSRSPVGQLKNDEPTVNPASICNSSLQLVQFNHKQLARDEILDHMVQKFFHNDILGQTRLIKFFFTIRHIKQSKEGLSQLNQIFENSNDKPVLAAPENKITVQESPISKSTSPGDENLQNVKNPDSTDHALLKDLKQKKVELEKSIEKLECFASVEYDAVEALLLFKETSASSATDQNKSEINTINKIATENGSKRNALEPILAKYLTRNSKETNSVFATVANKPPTASKSTQTTSNLSSKKIKKEVYKCPGIDDGE
jgi:hypothetical protein